jgi:hypothetical protein
MQHMSISAPIWFIWRELPILARLFVLVLASVCGYVVVSGSLTLLRVRSLINEHLPEGLSHQRSIQALRTRSSNTRQLIGAAFYLFGLVFFLSLPGATDTFGDSQISVGTLILRNFAMYSAYAANVFFVFLMLQLVQWFVSARVRACALRLNLV